MAKKGGSLHINYHLKAGVGKPDDKINVDVHRTGKGVHCVYNAGIAEIDDDDVDQLYGILQSAMEGVDDSDATTENHVAACRAAAQAFNALADMIESA